MSDLPNNPQTEAELPLVSKCRSKNGSQSSGAGSGGGGCKRRVASTLPAADESQPLPETAPPETAALMTAVEAATGTATVEETPPPKPACGCGHHATEGTAPQTPEEAAGNSCKCQKLRWIRQTHAALGLVFGLFLVEHFTAIALGLRPGLFEEHIRSVHATLRQAPWLEGLVFVPLLALVPFGLYLLAKAGLRYNVKKCKRGGKLRFFLQRISAVLILAFIAFHLLTLRNWGPWSAGVDAPKRGTATIAADSATTAFATSVRQIWGFLPSAGAPSMRFAVIVLYLFGTAAAVYHFTNGLWTGAIAWGMTPSDCSQQRTLLALTAFGILLMVLGALGWYAFIVAPWA